MKSFEFVSHGKKYVTTTLEKPTEKELLRYGLVMERTQTNEHNLYVVSKPVFDKTKLLKYIRQIAYHDNNKLELCRTAKKILEEHEGNAAQLFVKLNEVPKVGARKRPEYAMLEGLLFGYRPCCIDWFISNLYYKHKPWKQMISLERTEFLDEETSKRLCPACRARLKQQ